MYKTFLHNVYDTINPGRWVVDGDTKAVLLPGRGSEDWREAGIRTPSSSITSTITAQHNTLGQNIIARLIFILNSLLNE